MQTSCRTCWLILVMAALAGVSMFAQSEDHEAIIQMLRSASEAAQRGDAATAEGFFKRVIAAAPSLSDGYLGLGMVQLRESRPDEASRELARATELNPRLPGAHLFLGIAQYQMGQAEAALASLRAETALQPANSEALTWTGIIELSQNHPELAVGPLDQAKTLNPQDERLLYYCGRAHMLVAEADFRRLSELDPDSALVHRGLAESFDVAGQPEKAIAEYEAAIKKEPVNPDLYEALGEANLKMSRRDAAEQAYRQVLRLNPSSAVALYNLGRIDVERGKPESGVVLLRKAEAAHASAGPTGYYLGLGLAQLGQDAEAAKWLEISLANHPSAFVQQGAWFQLVRVYQKLGRAADSQHALAELKSFLQQQQQQKDAISKKLHNGAAASNLPGPTQP